jgi:hypothetical protein
VRVESYKRKSTVCDHMGSHSHHFINNQRQSGERGELWRSIVMRSHGFAFTSCHVINIRNKQSWKSSNAKQASNQTCELNETVISKYDHESMNNIKMNHTFLQTEPGIWLNGATTRELITRQASHYEDDFPLEFDTGLTLFVAAICIVAFLYALWATIYANWGCGLCAFIAAACAVCATWGGTARTKEVNSGGNWTAVGFGAFFFILSYLLMIAFAVGPDSEKFERRNQSHRQSYLENDSRQHVGCFYLNVSAIATLLALIPGMVVLAVYCKRMNVVEQHEYYGPMYISGYQTEFYRWYEPCLNDEGTCRGFYGQLNVSWGMEWGCPDYTDRWCSDVATDHDCTRDVCRHPDVGGYGSSYIWEDDDDDDCGEEEAYPEDQQAAEQCIIDKYELIDWLDELQNESHDYNRSETPEEASTAWPQVNMYGNCDTCTAKVKVPLDSAQDLKPIGIGLTLGGVVTDALLVCIFLLSRLVFCKKTSQVSQIQPSASSFTVTEPPLRYWDGKTQIP